MKVRDILALHKAGFSREEIFGFIKQEQQEQEKDPPAVPDPAAGEAGDPAKDTPAKEEPAEENKALSRLDSIENAMKEMQKNFQNLNITLARQPGSDAAPSESAEDILSTVFLGGKKE